MTEARRRPKGADLLLHLALTLTAALMVAPFAWQLLTAFKTTAEASQAPPTFWPADPTGDAFATFFDSVPVWSQFTVSAAALALRVAGQLAVAALAGYAFARLRFPGRTVLFGLFIAMLMVPSQLFLIGQFELIRDLKLLDTVPALAIPGMFSAFGIFLMRQAFMSIPPAYEEAARLDGAGPLRTFRTVMLPMVRPTLGALAVLTSLYSWNDLLWPLIVSPRGDNRPLTVGLSGLQGQYGTDYPTLMAGALVASLPLIVIFLVLQRQFFNGIASSGLKG
ncbi:carbohydrate ABC transporter membrane protein 2, CUT1 family [Glycomyces sambucus]|uniref:Carbohydrate ABC transporter membrane protein 2, CUT1 family n=1 Tax=Glycomyces sambucus TaxID=380244 RepID=A0A1G9D5F7_9ACTN|nr:carbohydrate ABC transporter permease [Glycomyces sambucus]SDK59111.1 carbohydrate ABC transporter membrane protein 2, CUT1 family [Glycomyces sambucus]